MTTTTESLTTESLVERATPTERRQLDSLKYAPRGERIEETIRKFQQRVDLYAVVD